MLTPRKRITKKQLKEDKFITYSVKAREWIEKNSKIVFGSAAIIIVIFGMVLFISNSRKKAEAAASTELATAMQAFESRDYNGSVSLFTNIVNSNKSTKSGKLARYYLAQSLYNTGEYAAAQEHFRKFAASFKDDDYLRAAALEGEAACLEQQEQFRQAATRYENIGKKFPDASHTARFYLRAARCFAQAGDMAKAREIYQLIIKEYPDSPEKNDAILYSSLE